MRLIEVGQTYLNGGTHRAPEEWTRLYQTMIELIPTCNDVEELREFAEMDQRFAYPPFVTHKTSEKLLELHDFSENTLWRYATQLGLYWSLDGYEELENYLFEHLNALHERHATEAEYVLLGEDIWKRVQKFHNEHPDWDELYLRD